MSHHEDPYRELAQWLQEVARRTYTEPVSRAPAMAHDARPTKMDADRARWLRVRHSISLAVLVAAYLQYHLLDVMLQIEKMHPVVTFI